MFKRTDEPAKTRLIERKKLRGLDETDSVAMKSRKAALMINRSERPRNSLDEKWQNIKVASRP